MVKRRTISRGSIFCLFVICFFVASTSFAQPQKNILRIWFDTITVKTLPAQVVMNCWFKLEGTKPHDFRGFQMPFIYEAHQIAPTNYFFSGSACENAGFHSGGHNAQTGNGSVVVLSSTELDLRKSLLFSIAFIAKLGLNDKLRSDTIGMMEVIRDQFELSIESGIDSVHITDGWIKYAKEIPPEPEKRKSIKLSSDSVTFKSDSSGWVSVSTSMLDSARIKRGVFSFTVDTSVIRFDTALTGSVFQNAASLFIENKATLVNLYLSAVDTSKHLTGVGELVTLKFTTLKREDTVSTALSDASFFALNTDNLLDTVEYQLGKIAVLGVKTPTKTVESVEEVISQIHLAPNPADKFVMISSASGGEFIEIYSLLGEKVYTSVLKTSVLWDTKALKSGWYQVLVRKGADTMKARLLIQH